MNGVCCLCWWLLQGHLVAIVFIFVMKTVPSPFLNLTAKSVSWLHGGFISVLNWNVPPKTAVTLLKYWLNASSFLAHSNLVLISISFSKLLKSQSSLLEFSIDFDITGNFILKHSYFPWLFLKNFFFRKKKMWHLNQCLLVLSYSP